jgi:hypothetical protein
MTKTVKLNPEEIEQALAVFAGEKYLKKGADYTVEWLGDGSVEVKLEEAKNG